MKKSHESVKTPKAFVLRRMGSLGLEHTPSSSRFEKRNIIRI